jgi:hypothetical protein
MNGLVRAGGPGGDGAHRDDGRALVHGRRLEPEAVDLLLEVARGEVAVDLGRDARVLVAHDPLDGGQVGALHEQQRGRRVAEVVEPKLPDLADGEQLQLTDRTASGVRVGRGLLVTAALPPALVDVARHDARAAHRSPEDLLHRRVLGQHLPALAREHQLRRRDRDGLLEVRRQLAVDRHRLDPSALRDVQIVRAAHEDHPRLEVDVGLLEREELALPHSRVERRREERLPLRVERREQRLHLVRAQVVGQTPRDLPLRHLGHRIRADELLHPPRRGEGPAEVAA